MRIRLRAGHPDGRMRVLLRSGATIDVTEAGVEVDESELSPGWEQGGWVAKAGEAKAEGGRRKAEEKAKEAKAEAKRPSPQRAQRGRR